MALFFLCGIFFSGCSFRFGIFVGKGKREAWLCFSQNEMIPGGGPWRPRYISCFKELRSEMGRVFCGICSTTISDGIGHYANNGSRLQLSLVRRKYSN